MSESRSEGVAGESSCRCARWRRFVHVASEHAHFEAHAEALTPLRWKREQEARIPAPVRARAREMRKAERRAYLRARGWERISGYGAEAWRSPEYPADRTFSTLAAATDRAVASGEPATP